MQLFAGKFSFCDIDLLSNPECDVYDGTACFSVPNRETCELRNGTWMTPHYGHFDHFPAALLILFETATLERWPDIMYWSMNAANATFNAPHRRSNTDAVTPIFYLSSIRDIRGTRYTHYTRDTRYARYMRDR